MLPNFLIIGAQKAATTWLATCLGEHPEIFIPEAKEIYFFNVHFDKGLQWYAPHFDDWSGQRRVGEATPGYISDPNAPARIHETLGEVQLIASLRHPVDRAYSAFWHYVRSGRLAPDSDFVTSFRRDDQAGIRSRGYYSAQLSRYLEQFPQEQILVLIFEEIFETSQQTITDCLAFLDVDPQFEPQALTARVNRGRRDIGAFHSQAQALRNGSKRLISLLPSGLRKHLLALGHRSFERLAFELGPKQKQFEPLAQALRQELLQEYLPDIQKLETMLDRDLSIWYEPGTNPHRHRGGGDGG